MIILNFYFDDYGGWIEYSQNNIIITKDFDSGDEIRQFISENNLNLTYKGCVNC